MGFGRGSVALTFQAVVHVLHLLSQDVEILCKLSRSIGVFCTDLGIEGFLPRVKPVALLEVLPFTDVPTPVRPLCIDCDGSDLEPAAPEEDFSGTQFRVDFSHSVESPGLLHVIHNLGRGLEDRLVEYTDAVFRLQKVTNVLRRKETKDRLRETCFEASDVARTLYRKHLSRYAGKCYRERWGTVAHAVLKMTDDVRCTLVWGWSLQKYLAGSSRHKAIKKDAENDEHDEAEHAACLDAVNDMITTYFWWSYWGMLKRIAAVLKKLLVWAESCSCHGELLEKLLDDDQVAEAGVDQPQRNAAIRACRTCPMRGRRCPEIACGDVVELAKEIFSTHSAELYLELPRQLEEADKTRIMNDWELARTHVVTMLSLKLHHWTEDPYIVFGMGHYLADKAFRAYTKAIGSTSPHPYILRLRDEALAKDLKLWEELKGGLARRDDPFDAPALRAYLAELRTAPSAERPAEAVHAVVHKEVKRAPSHGCAVVSMANRYPEIKKFIVEKPENFDKMAEYIAQITDGRTAVEILGLSHHPVTESRRHGRARREQIHYDVIYRADAWSKYSMPPPSIQLHRPEQRTASLL
jgi:hypothetical protein